MKRFAILYDFDYTLSDGFMQQFGLMQEFGYTNIYDFYDDVASYYGAEDMDNCLSLLFGVIDKAKKTGKKVTYDYMKSFGKNVKFFPGVKEWFKKINKIGKDYGFEIEHYVISSGNKEIIEGTPIAKYLKRVYATFFAYNKKGEAYWPCQIVNYSTKLQYVYRIRKNVLDDLASTEEVNRKRSVDEVLPFDHMVYLGDSQTDIPSFTVIKRNGGQSICVYKEGSEKSKMIARQCFDEGRVNHYTMADYREGSELFEIISKMIKEKSNK